VCAGPRAPGCRGPPRSLRRGRSSWGGYGGAAAVCAAACPPRLCLRAGRRSSPRRGVPSGPRRTGGRRRPAAGAGRLASGHAPGADDGTGRTHFQAPRLHAVLAHVAHHQPAAVIRTLELLDEADVPPVDAVEPAGVVVAVPGELPDPAVLGGELVPFLARDLA